MDSPGEQVEVVHPRGRGGLEDVAPDEPVLAVHQELPRVGPVQRVVARPVEALLGAPLGEHLAPLGHPRLHLRQPLSLQQPVLQRHREVFLFDKTKKFASFRLFQT